MVLTPSTASPRTKRLLAHDNGSGNVEENTNLVLMESSSVGEILSVGSSESASPAWVVNPYISR